VPLGVSSGRLVFCWDDAARLRNSTARQVVMYVMYRFIRLLFMFLMAGWNSACNHSPVTVMCHASFHHMSLCNFRHSVNRAGYQPGFCMSPYPFCISVFGKALKYHLGEKCFCQYRASSLNRE